MLYSTQIVEYLGSIIECLISIQFLIGFFGFKNIRYKYLTVVIAFLLLCVDNIFLSQKEGYETLSIILLIVVLAIFSIIALKGSVYLKIVISLVVPMLILVISMSTLYVISVIANIEIVDLYAADNTARLLVIFITKFLYFFITKKGIELFRFQEEKMGKIEWSVVLILFMLSFGIMMLFWNETRNNSSISTYLYITILFSVSIINILVYWLMRKINHLNGEKIELALSMAAYQVRIENVDIIKEQYEEILGIKHDIKNYLLCVSTLLQQGKTREAENYLNKINEDSLQNIEMQVFTNNEVVDAVLNNKINMCRKQGIKIDYTMEEDCIKIDNKDVSILLANLFDNAIEATRKCEKEGLIICKLDSYKKYVRIVLKNRISESVFANNPNLTTTKRNKKIHGYGMKTINRIIEKYNGMLNLSEEGDLFKIEILLMQ